MILTIAKRWIYSKRLPTNIICNRPGKQFQLWNLMDLEMHTGPQLATIVDWGNNNYLDQVFSFLQAVVHFRGYDPVSYFLFVQITVIILIFDLLETLLFSL